MPTITIERRTIEPGRRILVTSDIHGHKEHLRAVLEQAAFTSDDLLIIVGDIIEKGPDSLGTLRYIMELHERGNVIVTAGNVDQWRMDMLDRLCEERVPEFFEYLQTMRKRWKKTSLFDEMTAELGFRVVHRNQLLGAKERVEKHFSAELAFLRSRPTILETQNFTFVHAGLPTADLESLRGRSIYDVLGLGDFMSKAGKFDKYVVVGHWPVTLYSDRIAQANPIIDTERRIISIDGGCGLKSDGQLNLLIIPHIDCDESEISHIWYDGFPVVRALTPQRGADVPLGSREWMNIRWGDNKITVLDRVDDFVFASHDRTGHRFWMPASYLYSDGVSCNDYTDRTLPVNIGDRLALVMETSRGYIVKKNGETGWYRGEILR
ncbi:MAG: metallophosphoesterase [Clostridia bacterium]|nr:metallophosphoesterase [Clostridia bacterium]